MNEEVEIDHNLYMVLSGNKFKIIERYPNSFDRVFNISEEGIRNMIKQVCHLKILGIID